MDIGMIVESLKAKYGQTIPSSGIEYRCPECKDTGYIHFEKDGYSFSRECDCMKAQKAEGLIRQSGLAGALEQQTFDSFRTETDMQKTMKATAERWVSETLNGGKAWLYMGGNPGSGKTHICTAACGELLKHNIATTYMQWDRESRKLKSYVNDPDFETLVERYTETPVLYIDDLLKTKYMAAPVFTEADIKIAFTILNARYIRDLPTILSSEWDLVNHLLPADEGVFSRVYERCKGYTIRVPRDVKYNYRLQRIKPRE